VTPIGTYVCATKERKKTEITIMFDIATYVLFFKARVWHEPATFTHGLAYMEREGSFGKFVD